MGLGKHCSTVEHASRNEKDIMLRLRLACSGVDSQQARKQANLDIPRARINLYQVHYRDSTLLGRDD